MYIRQYNGFWAWKISVEEGGHSHILDAAHRDEACRRLLVILPRWQTYRGVKCSYNTELPIALNKISDAYNHIRHYSLLDFHEIPDEFLKFIWDVLGRVKEEDAGRRDNQDYFVISVCKPLMFLWGQTLAFDSVNRENIRRDNSVQFTHSFSTASRWTHQLWKAVMQDFQRELSRRPELIYYCQSYSHSVFGSNSFVPYGRFLDIYYYY